MVPVHDLYEQDYAAWAERNAELLRAGQLGEADLVHIAEELDGLSRSDRRALHSHLTVLLVHLLKWEAQPERRGNSGRLSMVHARRRIRRILAESPSLRSVMERELGSDYEDAAEIAAAETNLPRERFPHECPFTPAQLLDQDYLPE